VGHIAYKGKIRNAYKILDWKHGGKRQLERFRGRWEDNIRMNLRGLEWEVVD